MAFTPPAPSAVNFTSGGGYYEPGKVRHAFRFPAGTYAQPNGDALAFVETWYVVPNGLAANFSLPAQTSYSSAAAFTVEFFVEAHAEFTSTLVEANTAFSVDFTPAALAAHGVKGVAAIAVDFVAEATAKHGVKGDAAITVGFTPAASGTVVRYELSGEVRKDGILVNRLVRAYRRDDGSLVGEVATVAGKFKVPAGFVSREHYLVPIDTANDATDWLPPCANRVESVLAQDAA